MQVPPLEIGNFAHVDVLTLETPHGVLRKLVLAHPNGVIASVLLDDEGAQEIAEKLLAPSVAIARELPSTGRVLP